MPLPIHKLHPNRNLVKKGFVNIKGNLLKTPCLALKDPRIPFLPKAPTNGPRKVRPNGCRKTLQIKDPPPEIKSQKWERKDQEIGQNE